jgi:hypothetical protein
VAIIDRAWRHESHDSGKRRGTTAVFFKRPFVTPSVAHSLSDAGVLVRKLSQLTPLSSAKLSRLTLGISSSSVESAVSSPAVYTGLSWIPSPRKPAESKPNLSRLGLA